VSRLGVAPVYTAAKTMLTGLPVSTTWPVGVSAERFRSLDDRIPRVAFD
jgi:hypothetical protein